MTNTGKQIGNNYKTLMPDLTYDDANIEDALLMYHHGQANYDPNLPTVSNSIEGHLGNLQTQIQSVILQLGGGEIKDTQPTSTYKGVNPIPNGYIWVDKDDVSLTIPGGYTTVIYQSSQPGSPTTGTAWVNLNTNILYVYNGTTWINTRNLSTNNQTTSYTLASNLSDASKMIEINSSSSTTLTIPLESTANYPSGTQMLISQTGTGQVSVAGASGVTVNGTPGLKLRTQWSVATLIKRNISNSWLLYGDISA